MRRQLQNLTHFFVKNRINTRVQTNTKPDLIHSFLSILLSFEVTNDL